jgi:hypothetical protein
LCLACTVCAAVAASALRSRQHGFPWERRTMASSLLRPPGAPASASLSLHPLQLPLSVGRSTAHRAELELLLHTRPAGACAVTARLGCRSWAGGAAGAPGWAQICARACAAACTRPACTAPVPARALAPAQALVPTPAPAQVIAPHSTVPAPGPTSVLATAPARALAAAEAPGRDPSPYARLLSLHPSRPLRLPRPCAAQAPAPA